MKRFFSILMMSLLFISQTQAATKNTSGLKKIFDDFSFAVNVEWDQKDQSFYDNKVLEFSTKMESLKAEGLTQEELLTFIMNETKNENLKRDLTIVMNSIYLNKLSNAEAMELVKKTVDQNYNQGASWTSSKWQIIGTIAVVGFLAIWIIGFVSCISDPDATTSCASSTTCYYDGCYEDTACGCSH